MSISRMAFILEKTMSIHPGKEASPHSNLFRTTGDDQELVLAANFTT